jgi:hypothetical protein
MTTKTAQTREQRKAALIATIKCSGCAITLTEAAKAGIRMFAIGGGRHECATRLATGAC